MAVAENAGVKVDSSAQNLDNNNNTSETNPSDDQSPKADSFLDSSDPPTPDSDDRTNETPGKVQTGNGFNGDDGVKSEIKNLSDAFSKKLNPMAKAFVPHSVARTQSEGVPRNGLGLTDGFTAGGAAQPVVADGNGQFARRRRNFGQGRKRVNKRTSLAQKEDVIKRTVYVSEIDHQVTEENLAGVFVNCGQVVDCRVCGDPNSVLRFAFVEFTNEEGARAALSMSGTVLGFYPLKVLPSKTAIAPVNPTFLPRSEGEREMCMRTIYCTNIDKRISQVELKGFFEMTCGEVLRLRLGDYHNHTRIAFVEFAMADSAIAALHCSGMVLGALPIRVSPSKTPVRPHLHRP